MRAKFKLNKVTQDEHGETLEFVAVCKTGAYPADGSDEDNTFAKFSPSASCEIRVANPALFGTFKAGQKFYVDFTSVPETPAAQP